ncbi:MAG: hypothetical protein ACI4GA_03625 [Acutalibacteraceae bacterium]|nr:hypothetical protein [Oscillospiraceae bacterium]
MDQFFDYILKALKWLQDMLADLQKFLKGEKPDVVDDETTTA